MPQSDEDRERKITYYQWVPIILMLQAGMFVLPYALWRVLSSRSGIDLAAIVEAAISSQQSAYAEQREKMLRLHIMWSVTLNLSFKTCLSDVHTHIHVLVFTPCLHNSTQK